MANQSNGSASRKMAKLIVAEEKEDGNYGFRQKIVPLDDIEEEIEEVRELT